MPSWTMPAAAAFSAQPALDSSFFTVVDDNTVEVTCCTPSKKSATQHILRAAPQDPLRTTCHRDPKTEAGRGELVLLVPRALSSPIANLTLINLLRVASTKQPKTSQVDWAKSIEFVRDVHKAEHTPVGLRRCSCRDVQFRSEVGAPEIEMFTINYFSVLVAG